MRELKKAMGGKLDAVASPRPGRRGREPTDPENTRVVALRSDSPPPPTLPPGRLGPLAGGWGPGQAKKQLLQRSSAVQRLRSVRAALMLKCRVEEIALPTVPVPARRKAAPGGPDPPPRPREPDARIVCPFPRFRFRLNPSPRVSHLHFQSPNTNPCHQL